ncbi:MAG: hypothetical protein GAK45_02091 [Pseudomonas citronellolis]|nr:MAG: hypothetical protein GAK45_02091 [Pseudomonas citronellolis]
MAFDLRQQFSGFLQEHFAQLIVDAVIGTLRLSHDQRLAAAQAKGSQTGAGHVEKTLGIGQRVGDTPLQVALHRTQGLGQVGQLLLRWLLLKMRQPALHIVGRHPEHLGGGRQHQHRQRATHLLQQTRQGLQTLAWPAGFQAVADQVLGLLQHRERLLEHPLTDLGHVRAGHAAFQALGKAAHHAVERRLHVQQGTGHIHQHRIVHGTFALGQGLQGEHLVDDDPARLLEAQHCEGIGNMAQRRDQPIECVALLVIPPYEGVEPLLDPHQVVAQGSDHRAQGIAALAGLQLVAPVAQRQVEVGQIVGPRQALRRLSHQAVLGQRLGAAAQAQLVEQRQHHQRQVVARAPQALEVGRQLLKAAEQRTQAIATRADLALEEGTPEQLQFLGQARRAIELEHRQAPLHLMQVVDEEPQQGGVARLAGKTLQRLPRLAQAIGDGRLGPAQGDRVVTLGAHCRNGHRPLLSAARPGPAR